MIDFTKTTKGDILRLIGEGAPGYAELGDLLRVTDVLHHSVMVEDKKGMQTEFISNCGAARLEPTMWKNDFPEETPVEAPDAKGGETEMLAKYIGVKIIKATMMTLAHFDQTHGKLTSQGSAEKHGYLVIYPDVDGVFDENSHKSWSPKDVFEAAYRSFYDMTFGLAIEAMKKGKKVARYGWNGKDMFVYLVAGSNVARTNLSGAAMANVGPTVLEGASVDICPHIDMKAADGTIVVGWLASQTDILAEDWCIVE